MGITRRGGNKGGGVGRCKRVRSLPAGGVVLLGLWAVSGVLADGFLHSDEARWELSGGPVYRFSTRISVSRDTMAVQGIIADQFILQTPGQIGPMDGYWDRDYADGYVRRDEGTGNIDDPPSEATDHTWYWGYDRPDQYTGDQVRFESHPDVLALDPGDWRSRSRHATAGVDLSLGRKVWRKRGVTLGIASGFRWNDEKVNDFYADQPVALMRRYTDTYSAPHLPFPPAPHTGDYAGPGYLIPNRPEQRDLQEELWHAHSRLRVRAQMTEFRAGPAVWVQPHERVTLHAVPLLRLAHLKAEAHAQTTIEPTLQGPREATGHDRQREWIWGVGVETGIRIHVARGWYVGATGSGDWWSDDVHLAAEPFDARVALGKWSFAATIGREF